MQQTETLKINTKTLNIGEVGVKLADLGVLIESPKTQYELARFKGDRGVVVIYTSGKVVIQSKDTTSEIQNIFGVDSKNSTGGSGGRANEFTPHVGSDEVGKGDYFGPMVVCAAYLNEEGLELVKKLGVTDSKKLTDDRMLEIYEAVKDEIIYSCTITPPNEYNDIYSKVKNASVLLGMQHGEAIEGVLEKLEAAEIETTEVIIDQFSTREDRIMANLGPKGKTKKIIQFPKGESDPAVAVASVIARATFLHEWNKMEMEFGMKFPKGATNVISTGKSFVRNLGEGRLGEVAKLSFRTTGQVMAK